MEQHPGLARLERRDAVEDRLLGSLGEAPDGPDATGLGCQSKVFDRLDAKALVQQLDGLGPDSGDLEQVDERRREFGPEALVVDEATGRRQLGELVADGLADARDRRRMALPIGPRYLVRALGDGLSCAVIGDRLEDELALDLEDVADLVEHPRQLVVGEEWDLGLTGGDVRGLGWHGHNRSRARVPQSSRAGRRGGPGDPADPATQARRPPPDRARRAWPDTAPGRRTR